MNFTSRFLLPKNRLARSDGFVTGILVNVNYIKLIFHLGQRPIRPLHPVEEALYFKNFYAIFFNSSVSLVQKNTCIICQEDFIYILMVL